MQEQPVGPKEIKVNLMNICWNLPMAAWKTWMKIGRPGTSGLMGTRRTDIPLLMSSNLLSNFGLAAYQNAKKKV